MTGKLYGVGVGPGDPELMTVKAVNTVKKCDVVAFVDNKKGESVAYRIATAMVPEIKDKVLVSLDMPMIEDGELLNKTHDESAKEIEKYLLSGKNVAYLVLGAVTRDSTFMYLNDIVVGHGFETGIISGVTSFCAAAAATGISLCQWDENLIIVPSRHQIPEVFEDGKNYVLMKAGNRLPEIRRKVMEGGREAVCVENCGMENEKLYTGVDRIPDTLGYYSIVLVK